MSTTKFYRAWTGMKTRCSNKNRKDYKNYGGRGISICKRWYKFENFKNDMFSSYYEGLALDRIDNNKGYFKENCRWATSKEQNNNKRSNLFIEFNGKSQTLIAWANELGVKRSTLSMRYYVLKWSTEKILTYNIK